MSSDIVEAAFERDAVAILEGNAVESRDAVPVWYNGITMNWKAIALGALILLGTCLLAFPVQGEKGPDRHVAAGGTLSFERPSDFGLAVTSEQVLVRSYIPPCDFGFDYCLYYVEPAFEGTNFESAGIRIERREDLATDSACLTAPPAGYIDFEPVVHQREGYAISVFAPIQNAAVGHYSDGKLFRLAVDSTCFEFETRIAASQFTHYEPGTIDEFTQEDREALEARLHEVLRAVRLVDRPDEVLFGELE